MFCGTGSFKTVDSDPCSSPCGKKKPRNKNPYSARGLDKFSALLAELEARRAKIVAKAGTGSHGVAVVRFTYSNSDDWVPIIIKLRDDDTAKFPAAKTTLPPPPLSTSPSPPPREVATAADQEPNPAVAVAGEEEGKKKTTKKANKEAAIKWWTWGSMRPRSSLWPLAAALMLLCLAVFGRVFAICFTTVWWYLVPLIADEGEGLRRSMKKKDYGRRLSSKKHHHQDQVAAAAAASSPPRCHGHGRRSG